MARVKHAVAAAVAAVAAFAVAAGVVTLEEDAAYAELALAADDTIDTAGHDLVFSGDAGKFKPSSGCMITNSAASASAVVFEASAGSKWGTHFQNVKFGGNLYLTVKGNNTGDSGFKGAANTYLGTVFDGYFPASGATARFDNATALPGEVTLQNGAWLHFVGGSGNPAWTKLAVEGNGTSTIEYDIATTVSAPVHIAANATLDWRKKSNSHEIKGSLDGVEGTLKVTSGGNNFNIYSLAGIPNGTLEINGGTVYFRDNQAVAASAWEIGALAGESGKLQRVKAADGVECLPLRIGARVSSTFYGSIARDSNGGDWSLEKVGDGTTLTLCGESNYRGESVITEGTLKLAGAGRLAGTQRIIFNGGTLALAGDLETMIDAAKICATEHAAKFAVEDGADLAFVSALDGVETAIEKYGAGRLALAAAPVLEGVLAVREGTLAIPSGGRFAALEIADGATLAIADAFAESGEYDLFTVGEAPDEATLARIVFAGKAGKMAIATEYDGASGKVVAKVALDKLVWSRESGNWMDANAWTGETGGDAVSFGAGDSVVLASGTVALAGDDVAAAMVEVASGHGAAVAGTGSISAANGIANAGELEFAPAADGAIEIDAAISNTGSLVFGGEGETILAQEYGASATVAGKVRITHDTMLDEAARITGGGEIIIANSTLKVYHTGIFQGFGGGAIRLAEGGVLVLDAELHAENNNKPNVRTLGGAKIILAGGEISRFGSNGSSVRGGLGNATNNEILDALEVEDGCESYIYNNVSRAGTDQGCTVKVKGALTGAGTLHIESKGKSGGKEKGFIFEGPADGFTGTLAMAANAKDNYGYVKFANAEALGEGAAYSYSSSAPMEINHAEGTTARLGALDLAEGSSVKFANTGAIEIGRKASCTVAGAFTGKPLELVKRGAGTVLTFAATASVEAASAIDVAEGVVEVAGADLAAAVRVQGGATLKGEGVFDAVVFEQGALLDILGTGGITVRTNPAATVANATIVNGEVANGRYVPRVEVNADGTWTIGTELAKNGFAVIIR